MKTLSKEKIFLFYIQINFCFPYRNSFLPAPLQSHVDQLYEQIDDLTSQLSEERSKHKQTRIKVFVDFFFYCSNKRKYFLLGWRNTFKSIKRTRKTISRIITTEIT
jgi:VanZ family protein